MYNEVIIKVTHNGKSRSPHTNRFYSWYIYIYIYMCVRSILVLKRTVACTATRIFHPFNTPPILRNIHLSHSVAVQKCQHQEISICKGFSTGLLFRGLGIQSLTRVRVQQFLKRMPHRPCQVIRLQLPPVLYKKAL